MRFWNFRALVGVFGAALAATTVQAAALPSIGLRATIIAPVIPKGWVVDGSGGMSFASSNWTFQRRVKPGGINNGRERTLLVPAMQ